MGVGPSLPTQVPDLTAGSSPAVKEDLAQTEHMFRKADGTGKVTPVFEAAEVKHEKKWVVFEEFYDPCTWSEPVCFFESRVEADTLCLQLNLLSSKLIDGTATHFFVNPISSGLGASAKVLEDLQERVADQQVAPKPKTSSSVA